VIVWVVSVFLHVSFEPTLVVSGFQTVFEEFATVVIIDVDIALFISGFLPLVAAVHGLDMHAFDPTVCATSNHST
jgi:hypothetical protein